MSERGESDHEKIRTFCGFASVVENLVYRTLPVMVADARERAHEMSDVLGDCALLDIAVVVHFAHPVNAAEVVVWAEAAKRTLRLVHVHTVDGQLGRPLHEMETKSWMDSA